MVAGERKITVRGGWRLGERGPRGAGRERVAGERVPGEREQRTKAGESCMSGGCTLWSKRVETIDGADSEADLLLITKIKAKLKAMCKIRVASGCLSNTRKT